MSQKPSKHQGISYIEIVWNSSTGEAQCGYLGPAVHVDVLRQMVNAAINDLAEHCTDNQNMIIDTDTLNEEDPSQDDQKPSKLDDILLKN